MTRVFVLTNHKGGIGESTSATNIDFGITQVLHRAEVPNARVRLIDTDSQGHATRVTTVHNDYGAHGSLYTVLMADRQAIPYLRAQRPPLIWVAMAATKLSKSSAARFAPMVIGTSHLVKITAASRGALSAYRQLTRRARNRSLTK